MDDSLANGFVVALGAKRSARSPAGQRSRTAVTALAATPASVCAVSSTKYSPRGSEAPSVDGAQATWLSPAREPAFFSTPATGLPAALNTRSETAAGWLSSSVRNYDNVLGVATGRRLLV